MLNRHLRQHMYHHLRHHLQLALPREAALRAKGVVGGGLEVLDADVVVDVQAEESIVLASDANSSKTV